MPEITVKHNVKDAVQPQREVIPSGTYHAVILKVVGGVTQYLKPALQCISIEYQIVKTDKASVLPGEDEAKYAGRAVYQDYIIEPGPDLFRNAQQAFRIQQLIAATGVASKTLDGGQVSFNSDHLIGKAVALTLSVYGKRKKEGDDPKAPVEQRNGVDRIDSVVQANDADIV